MSCACDDGATNAWAYIVGRALLTADGGSRICAFLTSDGSKLRPLRGPVAYLELVDIMRGNAARLPQHRASSPTDTMSSIRMVKNDWGGAFERLK